jgi:hypothetical protein
MSEQQSLKNKSANTLSISLSNMSIVENSVESCVPVIVVDEIVELDLESISSFECVLDDPKGSSSGLGMKEVSGILFRRVGLLLGELEFELDPNRSRDSVRANLD